MKKILLLCIALLLCCVQAEAQKILNIYQDGLIIKKIPAAQVDSITLTDREPYTINMWSGGRVFQTYASEEVDSIKVVDEKGGPLSYLGIVGFNSELYKKGVSLLSSSTISQHESFIDNLSKQDGTILYYAVDNALDLLEKSNIRTQLSNINLVTFTDGLDQGSIMLNQNYTSSNAYLQAISNRIKNSKFKDLKVDAYTIGLRGTDVSDVYMFQQNLNSLASSDQNAFELTNMYQLDTRLQEIANKIINVNTRQTISVKIPGKDTGTRVRFTFDGKDADNSQLYIDGTLNLSDNSLRDITYYGMKARSGSFVQGTQDGIFITYTFRGLRKEYGDEALPTNNLKQYFRLPSSYSWQINSEFRPTNNTQRIVSHSGTAIILVLDCSSSLGYNGFNNMKSYAKKFIRQVANNALPFTFGTPSNVQASMDNNTFAINVSWDAVKGADYYQVYRSSNNYSSSYTLVADNVTSCSWKDTSLQGSSFYYKVCAVGYGMTSGMSNATYQVQCSLAAPQNVKGELTTSNSKLAVNVKWDPVKYAEYYQVYRSSSSYSSYNYSLIADNVTSTSYLDLSPLSGSNYYKIRAIGHGMTSSDSYSGLISNLMPSPTNVAGELVLDGEKMTISVTWDAVAVAEKYQVYRSSSSYGSFEMVADNVTTNSWKDTAPLVGSNYYKVVAIGSGLTSNQSNVSNAANCALDAPTNVVAALDNANFVVSVSWDLVKYASYYQVYRSCGDYGSYVMMADNVTSNSWKDTAPSSGRNSYMIYAVGCGLTSNGSNTSSVNCTLNAPTNVEATLDDTDFAVNISWDAVEHATYYQVYRSSSSSSGYTMVADNITSCSWKDVSPEGSYNYYKVYAACNGVTSSASYYAYAKFSLSAPQNVKGELTVSNSKFAVNVKWDPVKYAEYYQVYRSSSSYYYSSYTLIADKVTSASYLDLSPLSGNNYYKIRAVGHGMTSSDSSTSELISNQMSAPTNVVATLDNTNYFVNVSWDLVKYASSYKVYRSSSSSGSYALLADNVTSNSWKDTAPLSGSNYYKVVATGYGLTSNQSYASNSVNCTLNAPTNVVATLDDTYFAANISWNAVDHATHYKVYRSSNGNSSTYKLVADNITSCSWKDVSPEGGYNYYKVYAACNGFTSSASNYASVYFSLATPQNVKGELAVSNSKLAVSVKWDPVKYAECYQVYRSSSTSSYTLIADNVTSASYMDLSPLSGSNYYKIRAVGHGMTSSDGYTSGNINTLLIPAPTNVKGALVLDGNNLAINVTWDVVAVAEKYQVYRSNTSYSNFELAADNVTSSSWKDTAPRVGSNYYKVVAVGYGLTSNQSNVSNEANCALDAPQNVGGQLVINGNKFAINVTWDAVLYAENYTIYRSSSYSGTYTVVAENVKVNSWKDESPSTGVNYYKVKAFGHGLDSGQSSASNSVTGTINAPMNVKGERVLNGNKFAVNVTWDAVEFAQSYTIYRSNSNSSYGTNSIVAEKVSTNSWKDEAPLEGSNYYKVVAVGYGSVSVQSSYSNVVSLTLDTPQNLRSERAVNGNKFAINVTWNSVELAQSYTIYRSNSSSGTYSIVAENVSTNSWKDEAPLEGSNYYKVVAVGYGVTSAQSSYSNVVNLTLNAPQNLRSELVLSNNKKVVRLSWGAVEFATNYSVYRSNSYYGEYDKISEGVTSTTWNDESPLQGYNYYKVVASGYGLTSPMSSYTSTNNY